MSWYNSGNWNNATPDDFPHIMHELCTAINEREIILGMRVLPCTVSRTGTTVTVNTTGNHLLTNGDKCFIGGANESGFNGWYENITSTGGSSFTVQNGLTPVGAATGTIKCFLPMTKFIYNIDGDYKYFPNVQDFEGWAINHVEPREPIQISGALRVGNTVTCRLKLHGFNEGNSIIIADAVETEFNGFHTVSDATRTATASLSRSGANVTFTWMGHGFTTGEYILVSDTTGYNGIYSVTVIDPNTLRFSVSGSPATPETGTIYDLNWFQYELTGQTGSAIASGIITVENPTACVSAMSYNISSGKARYYMNMTDFDPDYVSVFPSSASFYEEYTALHTDVTATAADYFEAVPVDVPNLSDRAGVISEHYVSKNLGAWRILQTFQDATNNVWNMKHAIEEMITTIAEGPTPSQRKFIRSDSDTTNWTLADLLLEGGWYENFYDYPINYHFMQIQEALNQLIYIQTRCGGVSKNGFFQLATGDRGVGGSITSHAQDTWDDLLADSPEATTAGYLRWYFRSYATSPLSWEMVLDDNVTHKWYQGAAIGEYVSSDCTFTEQNQHNNTTGEGFSAFTVNDDKGNAFVCNRSTQGNTDHNVWPDENSVGDDTYIETIYSFDDVPTTMPLYLAPTHSSEIYYREFEQSGQGTIIRELKIDGLNPHLTYG